MNYSIYIISKKKEKKLFQKKIGEYLTDTPWYKVYGQIMIKTKLLHLHCYEMNMCNACNLWVSKHHYHNLSVEFISEKKYLKSSG